MRVRQRVSSFLRLRLTIDRELAHATLTQDRRMTKQRHIHGDNADKQRQDETINIVVPMDDLI
jgi:hypothetical protein